MAAKILVACESDLLALGIQSVVSRLDTCDVLLALNLEAALTAARTLQPAVILLSDRLDPDRDILTLVESFSTAAPATRIIILGRSQNGGMLVELLRRGVGGYLYWYDALETSLLRALDAVLRGRPYLSPTAQSEYLVAMAQTGPTWRLNPRARSVLQQLADGRQVKDIARGEGLTVRQVYGIQRRLRYRFGAATNEQLLIRAAEEGFIRLVS